MGSVGKRTAVAVLTTLAFLQAIHRLSGGTRQYLEIPLHDWGVWRRRLRAGLSNVHLCRGCAGDDGRNRKRELDNFVYFIFRYGVVLMLV